MRPPPKKTKLRSTEFIIFEDSVNTKVSCKKGNEIGHRFKKGLKHHNWQDAKEQTKCLICQKVFYDFKSNKRKFCSEKCMRIWRSQTLVKEKSCNWRGGITPESRKIRNSIQSRLWREAVFARDNWTCRYCRKKGGILHAHHIKSFAKYPELRFAIDNGKTLCRKPCHQSEHKTKLR